MSTELLIVVIVFSFEFIFAFILICWLASEINNLKELVQGLKMWVEQLQNEKRRK